jgi:hypothetical protein
VGLAWGGVVVRVYLDREGVPGERSVGDLRAPLAIAVIGGLIVATLLTLIVVPVIFSVVESARIAVAGEREPERARGRRTEEGRGFAPGPAQPEGAP